MSTRKCFDSRPIWYKSWKNCYCSVWINFFFLNADRVPKDTIYKGESVKKVQVKCGLYLKEVLDALRVVAVALSADPLHLFDLAGLAGGLDVFEVNFSVLTEVNNRAQEVEQTW